MNPFTKKAFSLLIAYLFISISGLYAQVEESSELFQTLAKNDSLLFVEGFNKCHKEKFEGLMADDLEFYHDTGGQQNREEFFEAYNNNICPDTSVKPIRKLIPGTLEVFTMEKNGELYGAIQKGEHEFYIKEPGKELYKTGFARFTHLWMLKEEGWVLTRVLSYDHKGAN